MYVLYWFPEFHINPQADPGDQPAFQSPAASFELVEVTRSKVSALTRGWVKQIGEKSGALYVELPDGTAMNGKASFKHQAHAMTLVYNTLTQKLFDQSKNKIEAVLLKCPLIHPWPEARAVPPPFSFAELSDTLLKAVQKVSTSLPLLPSLQEINEHFKKATVYTTIINSTKTQQDVLFERMVSGKNGEGGKDSKDGKDGNDLPGIWGFMSVWHYLFHRTMPTRRKAPLILWKREDELWVGGVDHDSANCRCKCFLADQWRMTDSDVMVTEDVKNAIRDVIFECGGTDALQVVLAGDWQANDQTKDGVWLMQLFKALNLERKIAPLDASKPLAASLYELVNTAAPYTTLSRDAVLSSAVLDTNSQVSIRRLALAVDLILPKSFHDESIHQSV